MFFKLDILKNFAIATGKVNKVADLKACNFLKTRLQHRCFLVNIAKLLRAEFFIERLEAASVF